MNGRSNCVAYKQVVSCCESFYNVENATIERNGQMPGWRGRVQHLESTMSGLDSVFRPFRQLSNCDKDNGCLALAEISSSMSIMPGNL